jgi:hypothetical protein
MSGVKSVAGRPVCGAGADVMEAEFGSNRYDVDPPNAHCTKRPREG